MSGISSPIGGIGGGGGGGENLAQTLILGEVTGASSGIFFSDGDGANFASSSQIAFSSTTNPLGVKDLYLSREVFPGILNIGTTSGGTDGIVQADSLRIGSGAAGIFSSLGIQTTSAGEFSFSPTLNATSANDTFIGRNAAGVVQIGTTTGAADGVLKLKNINVTAGIFSVPSTLSIGVLGSVNKVSISTTEFRVASNMGIGFSSLTVPSSAISDTSISRISAGVLGVGNGTQGDVTGTLSTGTVLVQEQAFGTPVIASATSPTDGYAIRANTLEFIVGGTRIGYMSSSGLVMSTGSVLVGNVSSFIIGTLSDAFISGDGATSGLVTIGTTHGASDGTLSTGTVLVATSVIGAPNFASASDTTLGIGIYGGIIGFETNGIRRGYMSDSGLIMNYPIVLGGNDPLIFGLTKSHIEYESAVNTVPTTLFALDVTSRSLLFIERGDDGFNFAHTAQTNPTLFIHSAAQSTNQWMSIAHDGVVGVLDTGVGGITFKVGGTNKLSFNTAAITFIIKTLGIDGYAASPAYSFTSDSNTGSFIIAPDEYGISTGGIQRLSISTTAITSALPILVPDGSAAAPSIAFASDADGTGTGFYRAAANVFYAVTNGNTIIQFSNSNTTFFNSPIINDGLEVAFGTGAEARIDGDGVTPGLIRINTATVKAAGTLHTGSLATSIVTKTTTYTTIAGDHTILADATSAAFTVTLIAAASVPTGTMLVIKKIDSSANVVTIDGNGAETIDGAATQALSIQYESVTIQSSGSSWYII